MTGRRYPKGSRCPETGKFQFTRVGAELALANIAENVPRDPDYREQRAYPCGFCGAWHLTHKPDKFAAQAESAVML